MNPNQNDGNYPISKLIRLVIGDDPARRSHFESHLGYAELADARQNLQSALIEGVCARRVEEHLPVALGLPTSIVRQAIERTGEQLAQEEEERKYRETYGKPEDFRPILMVLHPSLTGRLKSSITVMALATGEARLPIPLPEDLPSRSFEEQCSVIRKIIGDHYRRYNDCTSVQHIGGIVGYSYRFAYGEELFFTPGGELGDRSE